MAQPFTAASARADLVVATWNLHGDAGQLNTFVADLRAGTLTGGTPPHDVVVFVQEASATSTVDGLQVFFAPSRTVRGVERGNAILSSLPLEAPHAIELRQERQRRVAVTARVTVAGVALNLINIHLENRASWWKGGLPGDRARGRQMEALLELIPDGPAVLGGDLNTWFGTRERAYRAAAAEFPDALDAEPRPTFRDRLVLDHVFFRLPRGWRASAGVAPSRYGSDHYPVIGAIVAH